MASGRPMRRKIRQVIAHLSQANAGIQAPVHGGASGQACRAHHRGVEDRGLCGGLNINLFKKTAQSVREFHEQGVEVEFCLIGNKATTFFKSVGGKVVAVKTQLGDAPTMDQLIGTVKVMLDAYDNGSIDRLYLVYNEFVNTMTQKPTVQQLLPLAADEKTACRSVTTTGTTCTSRMPSICSTPCWCVSSSPRCIRAWWKTLPVNRPHVWWR
jgi:F-type H+-transporting ATPase subunit gamma